VFVIVVIRAVLGTQSLAVAVRADRRGCRGWAMARHRPRAQVLSLRQREFVEAARALGASAAPRIVLRPRRAQRARHRSWSPPRCCLPQRDADSRRSCRSSASASRRRWRRGARWSPRARAQVAVVHPWVLAGPGVAMGLSIFALNFLGDGLRDAIDPQTR
jgi:ABC-type dipeptide/oligopeptide/nickel transport system permease subunit